MLSCDLSSDAGSRFFPGERQVYVEARFGGLEVTLGDEHGDILSADMTGTFLCL